VNTEKKTFLLHVVSYRPSREHPFSDAIEQIGGRLRYIAAFGVAGRHGRGLRHWLSSEQPFEQLPVSLHHQVNLFRSKEAGFPSDEDPSPENQAVVRKIGNFLLLQPLHLLCLSFEKFLDEASVQLLPIHFYYFSQTA